MSRQLIVLVLGLAVTVLAEVQVRKISPKIVKGIKKDISQFPYQVSVQFDGWHLCGGAIIHPSWILTAAHCVRDGTAVNYTVRAGSTMHFSGGALVQVIRIIKHSDYEDNGTNNFDAALLELKTPLQITKNIRPISLTLTKPREGDMIVISGWGSPREYATFSQVLLSTSIPVISKSKCREVYQSSRHIYGSMFCAGFLSGGRDACTGDSGGPAVSNGDLVGIVSFGRGCGRKNSPGVYIHTIKIRDWIESQIY